MTCEEWLEEYVKQHQPVKLSAVYAAGKKIGFTRRQIKNARHWFGKQIDTQVIGDTTLWGWNW
jgi:hypothetical protein